MVAKFSKEKEQPTEEKMEEETVEDSMTRLTDKNIELKLFKREFMFVVRF